MYLLPSRDNRSIVIQVVSQYENSKPLEGAEVVINKDGKTIRSDTTVAGGRVTLSPLTNTPFQVQVCYPQDAVYLPEQIEITENDFIDRSQIFKEIGLKKKNTVITGKVVDAESKAPIPVVSVKVEPDISSIADTDQDGIFRIESPQFQEGIIYEISFVREQPYEKKRYEIIGENLRKINLFQTNDIGNIELIPRVIKGPGPKNGPMVIKVSIGRASKLGE